MAKLICEDGTEVQISTETEAELRAAFGPKPEPTYKVGDVFWRDHSSCGSTHYLQLRKDAGRIGLYDLIDGCRMYSGHSVANISAITLAEVRKMTAFPKGLRHVPADRLVISEK